MFCLSSTAYELINFNNLAGLSLLPAKLMGFLGKWPQKSEFPKKNLVGTSLHQTASFELSCVKIGSRARAVRLAKKEKIKIK